MDLENRFYLFDGAMGTMLQKAGLADGRSPEELNITEPDTIQSIHKEYVLAGCDIITTNTFGANSLKCPEQYTVDQVVSAAVANAKAVSPSFVALDVGPTGALLYPMGDTDFDTVYNAFKEEIISGANAGADLIIIETMSDLLEAKAAVLAATENCNLPIIVTMTFDESKRTFLGTDAATAALTLSDMGISSFGLNCSLGPDKLLPTVKEILKYSKLPVTVQANAGLPEKTDSGFKYTMTPLEYASYVEPMIDAGVTVIGGCCGTTPDFIRELRKLLDSKHPVSRNINRYTSVTSSTDFVIVDDDICPVGEKINPTGNKEVKSAVNDSDWNRLLTLAKQQQAAGVSLIGVNVGVPGVDEVSALSSAVKCISSSCSLPIQIDTSDPSAMDRAARIYRGKPIINSVNGKKESLDAFLPIAKKYGACIIGLALDENGIPESPEGRLKVAEKIVSRAEEIGIPHENIIIDCLVLTASTNQKEAMITTDALKLVKEKLGVKTTLGVSNISFGFPEREIINSTFLSGALYAGLDLPIIDIMSPSYKGVVDAFRVLSCKDPGSKRYISNHSGAAPKQALHTSGTEVRGVKAMITEGETDGFKEAVLKLLETTDAQEVIDNYFIPALDSVGELFDSGEMFLPQLMASAAVAKSGFDIIESLQSSSSASSKGTVLLATVHNDIHDIGKNIVAMLLKNYGFTVLDLGRDVPPEDIVKAVKENNIKLVGLSALMTTTVKSMEETINQLRDAGCDCKIMVGGAVLTAEYAEEIGADFYAKDAAASVKIAERIL